eukprot:CAMPEP_0118926228 /NCGR_PEP_ID=MMETSP1169-20130426/3971_1 /TAXON_ID=36882 /ORGANISM="Pyramimonas obovata, Strain CCMP722" /LENGTH=223 /DNA_ID=CAMNT_0006867737 /DNA_START=126 /DNA_END=793 /DNA_ORIENTATION=-
MESFATPYPVFFYDGETEREVGYIGVHSVLTYKRFQSLMSQKISLPVNQLSAVFVCRRTVNDVEKKQKLPINENTNFCIILNQHNPSRERDAHFLISVKKSKKDRKGLRKKVVEDEDEEEETTETLTGSPNQSSIAGSLSASAERSSTKVPSSPPSGGVPTSPASAQREAAQRERERLAIAMGRAQVAPVEMKAGRRGPDAPPLAGAGGRGAAGVNGPRGGAA